MPYSTHTYLQNRWDVVGRKLAFSATDHKSYQEWREKTVRKLEELIGYDTMISAPSNPKTTEKVALDGFTRERLEIETEPGVIMPFYVLTPHLVSPPFPAVLALHGHSGGGKVAVAGDRGRSEIAEAIDNFNYAYGPEFVRAGFITFCPDARGFGERQEEASKANVLESSCQWLNHMGLPLGQTVTGMWTWDIHRLIDYIQTRPDCRHDHIGCAGLSGGGLQTLWASALDTRIKCAVISGFFSGYKESLLDIYTNCSCNYVPHLWEYVDMGDIAALIAPRPLLVETGTRDDLNGAGGVKNVLPQMQTIRHAYRIFDAEEMLAHDVFGGGHRWHGVKAIPWMQRHLVA